MTLPNEPGLEKNFVRCKLPWIIAAGAAVVYFLTLNHWVSYTSLWNEARIAGHSWAPELHGPLFYLVTWPLRWLPAHRVPLALNLFAMVCAVLTLALLARSVALLPHDRTQQQRQRERSEFSLLSIPQAWMAPVLAVLVCGLQLTFWERATSGSSDLAQYSVFSSDEMFNLLLFAYVIRCLLEYRIGQRDHWMMRAALVWGAATTNSWLIFCFIPAFMIAVLWLKGLGFFNLRFLFRLCLCGALGLLFCLLLPLIHVLTESAQFSFWQAFKENALLDRNEFLILVRRVPINVQLLLAVSSLLPVLVIGIRWSSNFGDPSRMGSFLAGWAFHLAHAALLVACVWVSFDPVFSPRQKGFPYPMLYYLGALSVGYFSGYFLLVFRPSEDRFHPSGPFTEWMNRLSQAAIWALLVLVPAGLVWRNLSQIRLTNGPALSQFAELMTERLPGHGVILSDDSTRLFLAEAWLARYGQADKYVFLDTRLLQLPGYHAFQQKRYPEGWPIVVNAKSTERVDERTLMSLLTRLAQKDPVYYLEPSFGYYFEIYYSHPRGLSYELKPYPTNSLSRGPLLESEIAENEKFWHDNQPVLDRLLSAIVPPPTGTNVTLEQRLAKRLRLPRETNDTAAALGRCYSQALDNWGVDLQRDGRLAEALPHFQTACALNPNNICARANAELNRDLKNGRPLKLRTPKSIEDELGVYRSWRQAVMESGPSDDPSHRFGQGILCAQGNLMREAAQQFERVHELVPDNLLVRLFLTRFYIYNRLPQPALSLLDGFHVSDEVLQSAGLQRSEVVQAEAAVLFSNQKTFEAEQLLQQTMQKYPNDEAILAMVYQISSMFGRYTNALSALDRHLQLKPDDVSALLKRGQLLSRLESYPDAMQTFTRILALETNNYNAQLSRAFAGVQCDRFDVAKHDYECLRKIFPSSIEVNSGLAEIAWRQKDTNTAIYYYGLCLTNSNPSPEQARFINGRLRSLKGENP